VTSISGNGTGWLKSREGCQSNIRNASRIVVMREQVCILASCCLCTVWRNAVLKEWTAKKLAVMQERSVLERSPTTIYV